ncbi:MAG: hypothetical protein WAN36_16635 [Calditrichia bacterium]
MKIYGNSATIYQNPAAQRSQADNNGKVTADKAAGTPAGKSSQKETPQKINIPADFRENMLLNKKEQEFFTKMYPKAKKEIARYVANQQRQPVEKGKHIDVRG